jgi:hypothetical protein
LCCAEAVGKVLFVGVDEEWNILELLCVEDPIELLLGLVKSRRIIAIDHIDQSIRAIVVMVPKSSNLLLSTDIPVREGDVLVFHRLDIESDLR